MLPNFRILNPTELEKIEDLLKEYFSSCNLYILNILERDRKVVDLKEIFFEVDLKKTNATEKDKIAKICFSLEFFRKIEAYYNHMFDEKNKEYNVKIGAIIRNHRKNKKITQIELAERVGLGKVSIQKYESGERAVPFNVLVNIFKELDIDIDVLKKFFKNEEISDFKNILSSLLLGEKSKKKLKQILLFIDYFESLGFSFFITDTLDSENNLRYGTLEDFIRNPKVVIVKAPNNNYFNIGIKDFLHFLTLYSTNNIKNLYSFLEIYHLDRSDTINDPSEIDRMQDLFSEYPLTQESNFEEILEKLDKKNKGV